jgi:hypothetical protein
MENGFFEMDDTAVVLSMPIQAAQAHCIKKVHDYVNEHAGTKPVNIKNAIAFIVKARTTRDLAFAISNHVLAHPSENLKVCK